MDLLQDLQFGTRRRLPMFLQTEAAECGLASIGMVACFHGHRIDLAGLRRRFTVSLKGATLAYLIQIAGRLHLAPRPLRLELEEVTQLRAPCVLHWDQNHFVVLKSCDARAAVIHDPAFGVRRMSMAEVSKHFTGIALELTPTAQFEPADERRRIRLRDLMGILPTLGSPLPISRNCRIPRSPARCVTARPRKARSARACSTMLGSICRTCSPTCRSTAKLSLPPSQ